MSGFPIGRRLRALLAMTWPLAGCDIGYGIVREARLESAPPLECVNRVIEGAPGVTSVQNLGTTQGSSYSVSSIGYSGTKESHIFGTLQVYIYDSYALFNQSHVRLNIVPPQAEIDATRPVMQYIEDATATECGLPSLPSRVEEECFGVACPPLAGPSG